MLKHANPTQIECPNAFIRNSQSVMRSRAEKNSPRCLPFRQSAESKCDRNQPSITNRARVLVNASGGHASIHPSRLFSCLLLLPVPLDLILL